MGHMCICVCIYSDVCYIDVWFVSCACICIWWLECTSSYWPMVPGAFTQFDATRPCRFQTDPINPKTSHTERNVALLFSLDFKIGISEIHSVGLIHPPHRHVAIFVVCVAAILLCGCAAVCMYMFVTKCHIGKLLWLSHFIVAFCY